MAEQVRFTSNYNDKSTDTGFQFEFLCNRCGNGFQSAFQASTTGTVSAVIEGASSLFGGVFSSAANVTERVKSASWQKAHDDALQKAIAEVSAKFIQCPKCSSWVCREACWNVKKGLCKECAPDLGVEMAAAQASKSVEEIWAHAAMAEEDKKLGKENWRAGVVATCPKCEKPLATNAKFCPNCGEPLKNTTNCASCNAKLQPGAKFCGECGATVSST